LSESSFKIPLIVVKMSSFTWGQHNRLDSYSGNIHTAYNQWCSTLERLALSGKSERRAWARARASDPRALTVSAERQVIVHIFLNIRNTVKMFFHYKKIIFIKYNFFT
jgi:hypothetical protein